MNTSIVCPFLSPSVQEESIELKRTVDKKTKNARTSVSVSFPADRFEFRSMNKLSVDARFKTCRSKGEMMIVFVSIDHHGEQTTYLLINHLD